MADEMQALWGTSYLSGGSADYLDELYETYLQDPAQVDEKWRQYFASLPAINGAIAADVSHKAIEDFFRAQAKQPGIVVQSAESGDADHLTKQMRVTQLINAYRAHGHRFAKLDPLELKPRLPVPDLELSHHGLGQQDLDTVFNTGSFANLGQAKLSKIHQVLDETYCSTLGAEYMHLNEAAELQWFQQHLEPLSTHLQYTPEQKQTIYKSLLAAEGLEKYLGNKFVGAKRFGLEGGDSFIPMLSQLIQRAGSQGVKEVVMGMAHRGRLNVLVNIFGKAPADLFHEFEGKYTKTTTSGDVKYHKGYSSDVDTAGGPMHLALAFNPSHLEIVNPVVEGSVRARQQRRCDEEGTQVMPVLIHGDAAFCGQGVNMETFNFSQARGFKTGGTVHIVINNQIGFTTSNPQDARSTRYCTDIAKMVDAPILHVNGDDPEACVFVTQLALDYRMRFKKDVVIDLICYRRLGHNEADEPSGTQPLMYKKIRNHATALQIYTDRLIAEKNLTQAQADAFVAGYRDALDAGKPVVAVLQNVVNQYAVDWTAFLDKPWRQVVNTGLDKKQLAKLAGRLTTLPEGFELQAQVAKVIENRRKMAAGELPLDWGFAESLAFASLVAAGYPLRLSGEDVRRATFSHRHAALHDMNTGQVYEPLQHISDEQALFTAYDSVLSEEAVVAFEYGFATAEPNALVIWEAQYGDFANGAQVVFDQFINSGEQKWGRLCGLTLFLPHGFEGSGPEHSSARLERFLQLCAQENMQVCVPTTPAQTFHMLRRQMLRAYRKPLVVMTPKSLLRHKLAVSSLDDLANGSFELVIPEIDQLKAEQVKRVLFCSGKVYYDLLEQRRLDKKTDVALIRIEQLYPFPKEEVQKVLAQYKQAKEIVWCQEEPENQGSWSFVYWYLKDLLSANQTVKYVGRPAAAAPAVGYMSVHIEQQKQLVNEALN